MGRVTTYRGRNDFGIQPIHPADVVASVTTSAWAIITPLKTIMSLFFLLGITGLYARQANKAGWLGLAGFLLFSLCWALQTAYIFAEAFILPLLATTAPQLVDGLLGGRQRARQRGRPRRSPNAIYFSKDPVYARRPAVWHRDLPRVPPRAGVLLAITAR